MKYTLITSARNEGAFIARTLDSVVTQSQLPERWTIVDDGSTDDTGEIIASYAAKHPWIRLNRNARVEGRNFGAKAKNVNAAPAQMEDIEYDVLGNLDADTSFGPNYMDFLLRQLAADPKLGIAGTPFTQDGGYDSTRDSFEGENYVAGPIQLFRRECWNDIGGYIANPAGGVDWIAVMTARMKGWRVRSFDELRYHHHRSMGTAERNGLSALYSYGQKDYYLGNAPTWQLFRVMYRMGKRPYILGGLALLSGYCWATLRRTRRPISSELVQFHRADQMRKLGIILQAAFKFRKLNNFRLAANRKQA